MIGGVLIDYETADRICLCSLREYRDTLQQQLQSHRENGTWMHADDVVHNEKMIEALTFVMKDFGDQVYA